MSDILIKNMEMPKGDEDVKIIINADGSVYRIIGWAVSEKKKNAKAIELPPHGRLMDAISYAEVLMNWEKQALEHGDTIRADAYRQAREILYDRDCILEASNGIDN